MTVLIGGFAILALALNLHWGYTGLFNIGIVGFMAVGVYVTAIVTRRLTRPRERSRGSASRCGSVSSAVRRGRYHRRSRGATALRLKADYLAS